MRPPITFVSEATYDSTKKDKQKFVDITYRHSPNEVGSKKKNDQIHEMFYITVFQRTFYSGTQRFRIFS